MCFAWQIVIFELLELHCTCFRCLYFTKCLFKIGEQFVIIGLQTHWCLVCLDGLYLCLDGLTLKMQVDPCAGSVDPCTALVIAHESIRDSLTGWIFLVDLFPPHS